MLKKETIDSIVNQGIVPDEKDFSRLLKETISLLRKEQRTGESGLVIGRAIRLPPSGEAIIVGDLHGDLASLTHILRSSGFLRKAYKGENVHLIFLGDYGDRGSASIQVYYAILKLKELFPDKVILMRGNHEGPADLTPYPHDLPDQLKQAYGIAKGEELMVELRKLHDRLYNALVIEERAVLIHGGFPPAASSLKDLAFAHKNHPAQRYLEEMLWSDPQEKLKGTLPSPRGAGELFGADVTRKMLKLLNVPILIRGHESCPEGYRINHGGKVLTLFSTNKPPYSNKHAAYLQLDLSNKVDNTQQLKRNIKQFE